MCTTLYIGGSFSLSEPFVYQYSVHAAAILFSSNSAVRSRDLNCVGTSALHRIVLVSYRTIYRSADFFLGGVVGFYSIRRESADAVVAFRPHPAVHST